MLVLTRKKEQTLVIGDDVEVTVLDIQGDQIRLGVNAPKSVKVYRKELYLEIQQENKNAAKASSPRVPPAIKNLLKANGQIPIGLVANKSTSGGHAAGAATTNAQAGTPAANALSGATANALPRTTANAPANAPAGAAADTAAPANFSAASATSIGAHRTVPANAPAGVATNAPAGATATAGAATANSLSEGDMPS